VEPGVVTPADATVEAEPAERSARDTGASPAVLVERPAFEDVAGEEVGHVHRFLKRLGARPSDVEDLTHDVFVIAHTRWGTYDPARPAAAWLCGIAVHVMRAHLRKRRRTVLDPDAALDALTDPGPLPDEAAEQRWRRELCARALDTLEFDHRVVFVAVEFEGLSLTATAEQLGVPLGTVSSRLARARERFRVAARRLCERKVVKP
jgi:RNA polymerase sigma-70 factor (ECF subfamily)